MWITRSAQGGSIGARNSSARRLTVTRCSLTANGPLITNPNLYSNVEYDTLKDFTPIGQIATLPYVMVVNASKPYNSVQDIVAAAMKAPGKLNYSSSGIGTTSHLIGSMFSKRTGAIDDPHPLQGKRGINDGSLGRQHRLYVRYVGRNHPSRQKRSAQSAGRASKQRLPALPDVPTLAEAGTPVDMGAWLAVVAPRGMPDDLVQQLGRELQKVVTSPDQKERLAQVGATVEWVPSAGLHKVPSDGGGERQGHGARVRRKASSEMSR